MKDNTTKAIDTYVEKYKDKFRGSTFLGRSITELNSDQLRACICVLSDQIEQTKASHARERKMLNIFRAKGI